MANKWILVFLIVLIPTIVLGGNPATSTDSGGILYGEDHYILLTPPKGWVLDNQSGLSQGFHAVLYPQGSSWADSTVFMFVTVAHKKDEGVKTLEEMIQADIKRMTAGGWKVLPQSSSIKTKEGKLALVRRYSDARTNAHEAVAYIDNGVTVSLLVLNALGESKLKSAYSSFEEFVSNYSFLTDKVIIKK